MIMREVYIDKIPSEFKAWLSGQPAKCIRCKESFPVSRNWEKGTCSRLGNATPDVVAHLVRLKYIPNIEYTRQVALCGGCYAFIGKHVERMDKKKKVEDGSVKRP